MLSNKRTIVQKNGDWIKQYVNYGKIRPVKIFSFYSVRTNPQPVEVDGYIMRLYENSSIWVVLVSKETYARYNGLNAIDGFQPRIYSGPVGGKIIPNEGEMYVPVFEPYGDALRAASTAGRSVEIKPTGPEISVDKQTVFKTIYDKLKKQKNEVGIELELEALNSLNCWRGKPELSEKVKRIEEKYSLIHDIGTDGSVRGYGPEIRFNHPSLSKWTKKSITDVLQEMSRIGFTAGDSAGQHVHISHPKIWIAVEKCEKDLKGMNKFLLPISCRHTKRYGTGTNIIRNQMSSFGTLEIRVWESTLNPDLFRMRAKFFNDLVKMLIKKGVDYNNIWKLMPKQMYEAYIDMLFIENDHKYGLSTRTCLFKMSKPARAYARVKWGFNFKKEPKGE